MALVACVLKSGGPYTIDYIERLKEGVKNNLKGHDFVCLSDVEVPCDRIPLINNYRGWWSKIELFKLTGKVIYFDLDTVITGDLTEIVEYPHRFTMLSEFYHPEKLASGVMAWDGDYSYLYDGFDPLKEYPGHGDQGYLQYMLGDCDRWQDILPGQVVSRKVESTRNKNERVVCFHGNPRPHVVNWSVETD